MTRRRRAAHDRDADEQERRRYARGLPDYHDPLAGVGGAPPAQSALTLRLVLACFGVVFCTVCAVGLAATGAPVAFTIAFAVLALTAVTAVTDIVVIVRRKRRGEPG
jgi:hypothetical protein